MTEEKAPQLVIEPVEKPLALMYVTFMLALRAQPCSRLGADPS